MARCVKIRKHLCVGASSGLTAKQDSASASVAATTSSPQGSAHDSLYQGEWKRLVLDPWNIMTHNVKQCTVQPRFYFIYKVCCAFVRFCCFDARIIIAKLSFKTKLQKVAGNSKFEFLVWKPVRFWYFVVLARKFFNIHIWSELRVSKTNLRKWWEIQSSIFYFETVIR